MVHHELLAKISQTLDHYASGAGAPPALDGVAS
jgi:hypothetical protein